jgi:hypothetical protein
MGQLDQPERVGIRQSAEGDSQSYQRHLFDDVEPQWVEVDLKGVRVERCLEFGGPWLAVQLLEQLGLSSVLKGLLPEGREEIPWAVMGMVLVIARFCDPSSELYIAEHFYGRTALYDLLGVPVEKVDDDRLYRALDRLCRIRLRWRGI